MSGHCSVDRHLHRFRIADLTNHDDVRICPQKRFHRDGKGQARLWIHLHLTQAALGNFNRVFRRPDLGVGRVQKLQNGMQRGRLAGAGRAAHVKQAIGLAHGGLQPRLVVRGEAQLFQWDRFTGRQNPHHHVFHTAGRRDGGDAQLDIQRSVFLELDLAVLRLAALGDVEFTHDLQPRHHGLAEVRRHLHIGHQAAVDAEADAGLELARHRFDVDVRGLLVVSVDDDLVDELHQLVVGGGRLQRVIIGAVFNRAAVHIGQQLVDGAVVHRRAKQLRHGLGKVGVGGDAVGKLAAAWEHLRHHARAAHRLGVAAHDDQAFGRLFQRNPALLFDELALEHAL